MELQTPVIIPPSSFKIESIEKILFVGSCFADSIGRRFQGDLFQTAVNPYGVMYNPASILHTIQEFSKFVPDIAVITLGTNHIYIERSTGNIVDNCQKRPQQLFEEKVLNVDECTEYLLQAVQALQEKNPAIQIIFTVSPIRYKKYGFHESQLSKATLLLASDNVVKAQPGCSSYFPAYEIMMDFLRDYRFYSPDMIHPSEQAVDYIYEQFVQTYGSADTLDFLAAWKPLKDALHHRPFRPDSEENQRFQTALEFKIKAFQERYPETKTLFDAYKANNC